MKKRIKFTAISKTVLALFSAALSLQCASSLALPFMERLAVMQQIQAQERENEEKQAEEITDETPEEELQEESETADTETKEEPDTDAAVDPSNDDAAGPDASEENTELETAVLEDGSWKASIEGGVTFKISGQLPQDVQPDIQALSDEEQEALLKAVENFDPDLDADFFLPFGLCQNGILPLESGVLSISGVDFGYYEFENLDVAVYAETENGQITKTSGTMNLDGIQSSLPAAGKVLVTASMLSGREEYYSSLTERAWNTLKSGFAGKKDSLQSIRRKICRILMKRIWVRC